MEAVGRQTVTTNRVYPTWVIDATNYNGDGIFCFCPIEGDNIILGMNYVSSKPPGKLVGVIHAEGDSAAAAFCSKHEQVLKDMML